MSSKFLNSAGAVYADEAAHYLEDRGLAVGDVEVVFLESKNMGLENEDGTDFTPQGWAFVIKGPNGLPMPGMHHIRVCNYPATKLYVQNRKANVQGIKRQRWSKDEDRPKFLQGFKEEFLYFTKDANAVCHSNVVMLHEKITSAELATKYLDVPCLAVSGCHGWSKQGKMGPMLEMTLKNLATNAKLIVCFDGDIVTNPGIMEAARGLKGWVKELRKDITITFLLVPVNPQGVGWDDWCVHMGPQAAQAWAELIIEQAEGVEITDFLPPAYLVEMFQLETKELRDGTEVAVHTLDNYERLARYPKWSGTSEDISGLVYDSTNIELGPKSLNLLVKEFRKWLETSAYRGQGEAVRNQHAKDVIETLLELNKISVPIELLSRQPEVTYEEANAAALKLITEGMWVNGPMAREETITTLIRMARDIVALWTLDPSVDVQWCCALVGPSGCGKSNFPHSFVAGLSDLGYSPNIAILAKDGNKAELTELFKACRDSLIGVFDEYDPAETNAKQVEQNIFTLSTTRKTNARMLYADRATECMRHASIFLTTTDKNRSYIRSSKGAGERRFITLEVQGVVTRDGQLTSNRQVIKECGLILLRYGLQLYLAGDIADATEFSKQHTDQYLGAPGVLGRLGQLWARADLPTVLKKFGEDYTRPKTTDVRFTMPIMMDALMPQERVSRQEKADLREFIISCGAENIGKGRIRQNGKDVQKDEVWCVTHWEAYCEALLSKI